MPTQARPSRFHLFWKGTVLLTHSRPTLSVDKLSFAASELHPVGFFSSLFPIWQDFSYSKPVLLHIHSPFWVGPAWFKEPKLWMTVSPLNFPKVFADHIFLNECVFTTSVHDAWTARIRESPYPPLINWLLLSAENKDNQLLGFLNFWILLLFFFFFPLLKLVIRDNFLSETTQSISSILGHKIVAVLTKA